MPVALFRTIEQFTIYPVLNKYIRKDGIFSHKIGEPGVVDAGFSYF